MKNRSFNGRGHSDNTFPGSWHCDNTFPGSGHCVNMFYGVWGGGGREGTVTKHSMIGGGSDKTFHDWRGQ